MDIEIERGDKDTYVVTPGTTEIPVRSKIVGERVRSSAKATNKLTHLPVVKRYLVLRIPATRLPCLFPPDTTTITTSSRRI